METKPTVDDIRDLISRLADQLANLYGPGGHNLDVVEEARETARYLGEHNLILYVP